MHFKLKKKIEQYFTVASDEVSLMYDDGIKAVEMKRNELKHFTEKVTKEIENLSLEKKLGAVIGVAFDVNSKNILNILPSIFAVLLVKVFNRKISNFVAIYSKELVKCGLE